MNTFKWYKVFLLKNYINEMGVVVYAFNPNTRKLRQVNLWLAWSTGQ